MATSFGGFIASALGGAAQGYGEGAQMEMKKQSELDLKKQLLDAEAERNLRVDDINRQRINDARLADEKRVQSPDYLKAQAQAAAAKFNAYLEAGVPAAEARLLIAQGIATADTKGKLAPVNAAADVLVGTAAADTKGKLADVTAAADVLVGKAEAGAKTQLIPTNQALAIAIAKSEAETKTANAPGAANADAVAALAKAEAEAKLAPDLVQALKKQYDATKEFVKQKATDLTAAKAAELKELVTDSEYMKALKAQNATLHQHLLDVANINKESAKDVAQIRGAFYDARTDEMGDAATKRLEQARLNSANRGTGGNTTPTTADLQRQVTAAENALAAKLTVKKTDLNEELGVLQRKTDPASKARLEKATTEIEALNAARKRLTDWSKTPAAAAPAAAAFVPAMPPPASTLPPLKPGMFETKK